MKDASVAFKSHFGVAPSHTVRAPGRLELLGNHTDYNEGLVLSLAVDRYIEIAVGPRNDGKIELFSTSFPKSETFWLDRIEKNLAADWANYPKGVLQQLRKKGVHFTGFNAAIHSSIPMGAGMSSSAAFEVSTAMAVRQLFPFSLSGNASVPQRDARGKLPPLDQSEKLDFAKVCRAAENEFVGVNCGLLDQISSLFGKAAHVMETDFQSLRVKLEPIPGEAIIVCNCGVKHSLVEGAYNELRRNCEAAARVMGVPFLRSADFKMLNANKSKMSQREYECAHHVIGEIQRVSLGSKLLRENDHVQFGQFMFQSHESSRDFFKNSVPELDTLVDIARGIPGCLGARLTGGGFGGATINLVAHHQAEHFMRALPEEYFKRTGIKTNPILCQIVDGAA